jgi:hypothetical protein
MITHHHIKEKKIHCGDAMLTSVGTRFSSRHTVTERVMYHKKVYKVLAKDELFLACYGSLRRTLYFYISGHFYSSRHDTFFVLQWRAFSVIFFLKKCHGTRTRVMARDPVPRIYGTVARATRHPWMQKARTLNFFLRFSFFFFFLFFSITKELSNEVHSGSGGGSKA